MIRRFQQWSAFFAGIVFLANCGAEPRAAAPSIVTIAPSRPPTIIATSAPVVTQPVDIVSVALQIHDADPKTLLVSSDGTISLKQGDKIEQARVTTQALADLQRAIRENDFFALQKQYPGTKCCDFIAHTITVNAQGKQHTVYCYNQCPPAFDKLKDTILHLWPREIPYQGGA